MRIPRELRQLPQWVVWRYEDDPKRGKPRKRPINPRTLYPASVTNSAHWGSYKDAVAALNTNDSIEGLGFVFTEADPYVGVDLDGITERDAKGRAIIETLASYTEASPSGKGRHIICKGDVALNGARKDDVEVYAAGRFFTMTGDQIGDAPIAERSAELTRLLGTLKSDKVEEQFTPGERIGSSLPDNVVMRLIDPVTEARLLDVYAGEWEPHYASASEADLALANGLAYWTGGDYEQTLRLLQLSGIWRDKWERPDYQAHTLGKAIGRVHQTGNVASFYRGGDVFEPIVRPHSLLLDTLLLTVTESLEEPPVMDELVPGLLPGGEWVRYALMVGMGGLSKSMFALQIALGVATGAPIAGLWAVDKPRRVVYLSGEDPRPVLHQRMHNIMSTFTAEQVALAKNNLRVVDVSGHLPQFQFMRMNPQHGYEPFAENLEELLTWIKHGGDPALLIADTLSRFAPLAEDSNPNAAAFAATVTSISDALANALVLIIHHARKAARELAAQHASRGASTLVDNSRHVISLSPVFYKKSEQPNLVHVHIPKTNYMERKRSYVHLRRGKHGILTVHSEALTPPTDEELDALM